MNKTLWRIVRAPFFLISVVASMLPTFFICAVVSVGAWCEDALRWFGYRSRPCWLPGVMGIIGYAGLGVAGPAYLGDHLIGWPGAVLGPLLILALIAILGRW